jgi:DNA-binding transcriptional LysR family regulator
MTRDVFFSTLPHLIVSEAVIGSNVLEEILEKQGWSGRPALMLPSVSGVIPITMHTDLCAVLPEAWLKVYTRPPGHLPSIICHSRRSSSFVEQRWHTRNDRDPGLRWLRRDSGFCIRPPEVSCIEREPRAGTRIHKAAHALS